MSLQVWLPLNGDLHNQGLCNVTVTNHGATINNNGKIGKCYQFDNNTSYIALQNNQLFTILNGNTQPMSICFWVYQADSSRAIIFGDYSITGGNNFNIELTTGHLVRWYWGTPDVSISTMNIGINTWAHVAFTYNGTTLKGYLNGIEKYTNNIVLAAKNRTSGEYWLGRDGRTGTTTLNGYLNDFRIYDHCLSQKEVEEISKGLVLHYKLDNNGMGGNNLAINTKTLNVASSKNNLNMYIRGASTRQLRSDGFYESKGTAAWQGLSFWANQLNLTVGTKVTYSFYIYGNGSSRAFSFYPMMYNSAGTRDTSTGMPISIDGGAYTTVNSKAFAATTATTPEYHYVTFEWNQAVANIIANGGSIELSIQVHGTWNSGDWVCLFAPKVEIGDIPTPWSPNPADLGIDSSIVYDSSGYENNGVITGNVQTDGNTVRYSCSMKQANGQYIRVQKRPVECMPKDAITVNIWQYATTWNNPISCTEGGGWNFENSSGIRFPIYISGVGYKVAQSSITPASTLNAWHMLTGTMDKDNIKIYYDGQEVGTIANGSTNGIRYANNYIFIGGEASGNQLTPASSTYAGNLSDIRIYATALTPNQIKELYNTSATIDNFGNVYAREMVE